MRCLILSFALLVAACEPAGDTAVNEGAFGPSATGEEPVPPVRDPDAPVSSHDPPVPPPPDSPASDCPVIRSSDWRAHVDAMPGPNANPRLIVSGKVTVPTGGYKLALRMGQVAESYPVQITIYLDVIPPSGAATQVLVTHEVRGAWPSEERVGAVTIRCGSRALAHLSNIATAH